MSFNTVIRVLISLSLAALPAAAALSADPVIRVGVSGGPMERIVEEAVVPAGKREGLDIRPVVFSGYVNANRPLEDGDIEANAFQHVPFLRGQIATYGYHLTPVGYTLSAPLGIYSARYKTLDELPDGATIGVPADDTNLNRALLILQHYGLIRLRADLDTAAGDNATPQDIVANPKHLDIREADTLILARSLQDFDAAAIITAQAAQAGLSLTKDAIAVEPATSHYRNVVVVRDADAKAPWVPKLVRAFHSPEVRALLEREYQGTLVPAF